VADRELFDHLFISDAEQMGSLEPMIKLN